MELAATVSADTSGFSVSFNEYLKLVSNERKADPDEAALLNMFRWGRVCILRSVDQCFNSQKPRH